MVVYWADVWGEMRDMHWDSPQADCWVFCLVVVRDSRMVGRLVGCSVEPPAMHLVWMTAANWESLKARQRVAMWGATQVVRLVLMRADSMDVKMA